MRRIKMDVKLRAKSASFIIGITTFAEWNSTERNYQNWVNLV